MRTDRRQGVDRRLMRDDRRKVAEEALQLLCDVYHRLWSEAYYDPSNQQLQKFCEPLAEKMRQANDYLRFKK